MVDFPLGEVSVSLRSIIHSYIGKNWDYSRTTGKFPSPYGVSFILMKFFIAYDKNSIIFYGFRLLTEYHSFLFVLDTMGAYVHYMEKFPSPYGVSFILMNTHLTQTLLLIIVSSFRLLTEYHSFLSYGQKSLLLQ